MWVNPVLLIPQCGHLVFRRFTNIYLGVFRALFKADFPLFLKQISALYKAVAFLNKTKECTHSLSWLLDKSVGGLLCELTCEKILLQI